MNHTGMAQAVPIAVGLVVVIAGMVQFTQWKAYHLAHCRKTPGHDGALPVRTNTAWRLGLHFGLHCGLSCANLTAILLVIGIMDLRAMAAVTTAITAERLAPAGGHVARAVGVVIVAAGLFFVVRAVKLQ